MLLIYKINKKDQDRVDEWFTFVTNGNYQYEYLYLIFLYYNQGSLFIKETK